MKPDDMLKALIGAFERDGESKEIAEVRALKYLLWKDKFEKKELKYSNEKFRSWWINQVFFYLGKATVIFAPAKSGKTNLASWLTENILQMDEKALIITDVPFLCQDIEELRIPRIQEVRNMSELLYWIAKAVLDGFHPYAIIDEMDMALTSKEGQTKKNKGWARFIYIERHPGVKGPLLIFHRWKDIPNYLRGGDLSNFVLWIKKNESGRWISSPDMKQMMRIPLSSLPYGSQSLSGWEIDIDVEKLFPQLKGNREEICKQIVAKLERKVITREGKIALQCLECGNKWRSIQRGRLTCSKCGGHAIVEEEEVDDGNDDKE